MNSTVKKAKTLFPRVSYPIHHTFMDVLFRCYSTDRTDITRADIAGLSKLMGKGFTDLVYLVKNIEKDENSRKFLDHCLKLKVNAKKMKSATGEELSVDQNLSARLGAINSYRVAFEKEELELKKEAERLKNIAC